MAPGGARVKQGRANADAPPETKGYVYLFRTDTGIYKIGSSADPTARLQDFSALPFALELVHQMPSNDPRWVERMLHKRFAAKRVRGEWFALDERDVQQIVATARCDRPKLLMRKRRKKRRVIFSERNDLTPMDLGCHLQQLRKAAGLSQSQLAEAAGVPITSLRNWERGRREPLASAVGRLAHALRVSTDELIGPPMPSEKRPRRPKKDS